MTFNAQPGSLQSLLTVLNLIMKRCNDDALKGAAGNHCGGEGVNHVDLVSFPCLSSMCFLGNPSDYLNLNLSPFQPRQNTMQGQSCLCCHTLGRWYAYLYTARLQQYG